ncbi:MAG: alpha/beta hydrolase family protein [Thermoanaerobaculia bacterium]
MPTAELFRHRIHERNLHGVVHLPDERGVRPAVVICHGFKGFMDWGFFPYLADLLAARGFVAIRFNFSGSGMKPGDELVTDTEAFRLATLSKDVAELRSIIGAVGSEIAHHIADPKRIAVLGHSRGGGTSLLAAASLPLKALVTWSAVAEFNRLSPEENAAWREHGSIPVVNTRTGQELEIGKEVLDDLEANSEKLDIQAAARARTAPWLIVHGEDDETVPVEEAETLAADAEAPVSLLRIQEASHTFGVTHPFAGPTPQLIEAMNATQSWLRQHLN